LLIYIIYLCRQCHIINKENMEQNQPQPPVFNQQQPAAPQYQPRVTATPMMNPIESVTACLKKFFNFKGRARRSEFWWFALSLVVLNVLSSFLGLISPAVSLVLSICVIVLYIPQLAVLTRRLHDGGHSGWWVVMQIVCMLCYMGCYAYLLGPNIDSFTNASSTDDVMAMSQQLVESIQASPALATVMMCGAFGSLILFIITLIFALQDSKWDANKYGPSPKYK